MSLPSHSVPHSSARSASREPDVSKWSTDSFLRGSASASRIHLVLTAVRIFADSCFLSTKPEDGFYELIMSFCWSIY